MQIEDCDPRVVALVQEYVDRLALPSENLSITTNRAVFASWLRRPVPFRIGGAYSMNPTTKAHRVFVHLERLDLTKPFALEVVVAEELIHMRDHLRGDFRRHSHHGFDRIAVEVERITGFTAEQQRSIFKPRPRRMFKHLYQCPRCAVIVPRRRRGIWSCALCSPRFSKRLILREVDVTTAPPEAQEYMNELNRRISARD